MNNLVAGVRVHPYFLNYKRPSAHSKFSPSSADRWLKKGCSFSVEFCISKQIKEEDSKYSIEGTAAHSLGEALFRQVMYGMTIPSDLLIKIATITEDGGKDMFYYCGKYVEVIRYWLSRTDILGDILFFGQEIGVPVFPDESCFGTADFIIIGTKSAVIIDFKYGVGKAVKADTDQLKVYAAGIARWLENLPADYKIHIVIHQPRVDLAPKETEYGIAELYQFLGVIWESIQYSKQKDLQPIEGSHCFWCPARRTKEQDKKCPLMLDKVVKLNEERFQDFLADMNMPVETVNAPNHKRDAAILRIHAIYPILKSIYESTLEEVEYRLQKGEAIPGFYFDNEEGKREINGKDDNEKALMVTSKYPGVNPWREVPASVKLKTLGDLEKEIGKKNLDVICTKKIKKKVALIDEKMNAVLGDMVAYAQMIKNNNGMEE